MNKDIIIKKKLDECFPVDCEVNKYYNFRDGYYNFEKKEYILISCIQKRERY